MFSTDVAALVAFDQPAYYAPILDSAIHESGSGPSDSSDRAQLSRIASNYQFSDALTLIDNSLSSLSSAVWNNRRRGPAQEVVFIDESVTGWNDLVADIQRQQRAGRSIDYVLLDAGRDGIQQISNALSNYRSLAAIHIVGHGIGGGLKLGGQWLTVGNVAEYSTNLLSWRDSLVDKADILLYGCNLAASEDGKILAEMIGILADADVAASDDATGGIEAGADWDLEYQLGSIDQNVVFSSSLQVDWDELLDGTININQAWLDARGVGPYYLDDDNSKYVLQTDVSTAGTAFAIIAPNITFDLNGHTVTYDNATPITVFNGSFEQGTGGAATGWDFTSAGNAARHQGVFLHNEVYKGTHSLKFAIPAGNQFITSTSNITLQANTTYSLSGMFEYGGRGDTWNPDVKGYIRLVGNGLPTREVSWAQTNWRGIQLQEGVFRTGNSQETYTVQVGIENGASAPPSNFYIDDIKIQRTKVYGVFVGVASWAIGWNTTDLTRGGAATNAIVTNGTIRQGSEGGTFSHPVMVHDGNGATVSHLNLHLHGANSSGIYGWDQGPYRITVRNNTITSDVHTITTRDHAHGAVILGVNGNIFDNVIENGIHAGIVTHGTSANVYGNTVRLKTKYTNSFAIIASPGSQVYNNIIDNGSGEFTSRGIMGYGSSDPSLITRIYNNTIRVQGKADNQEYEGPSLGGVYGIQCENAKNIEVYGNDVYAYGNNGVDAYAFRANSDAGTSSSILVHHNTFRAISDGTTHAAAIKLSDMPSGILTFEDNHLVTNEGIVASTVSAYMTLGRSKITVSSPITNPFIIEGDWAESSEFNTQMDFVDTIFTDAGSRTYFENAIALVPHRYTGGTFIPENRMAFSTNWTTTIQVNDGNNAPLAGTPVVVRDQQLQIVFDGLTNAQGEISFAARQFRTQGDVKTVSEDHEIIVTHQGTETKKTFKANQSQTVTVIAAGGSSSENTAPVLGAIGNRQVNEQSTLSFSVSATDQDAPAQSLTYSLDAASISAGMTINASTGAFAWTPSESQGGSTRSVTITVTDNGANPANLTDSETFQIAVAEVNAAPVLGVIGNRQVNEQSTLNFTVGATDSDAPAQTRTYSLDAASTAAGMTINSSTGAFAWTPSEAQGGTIRTVTITVTDNGANPANLTDSETFQITVAEVNAAPVLGSIGNRQVNEQSTLSFTVGATDQDAPAQTRTYSLDAASIGAGMTINSSTGAFAWTPSESQGGTIRTVTITVTDNGANPANLTDSETFQITVVEVNAAPVLSSIANRQVNEQSTLNFTVGATDSDAPAQTLTYSLDAASIAAGMTINSSTGAFSWTPSEAQGGSTRTVTITVRDNGTNPANLTDSETFQITVAEVNPYSIVQQGNHLIVQGNSDDNYFRWTAANPTVFTIDAFQFDVPTGVDYISFSGGNGTDTVELIGSAGDDVLTANVGSCTLDSGAMTIDADSLEHLIVDGGSGGNDSAELFDSTGDDLFSATSEMATFSGSGFSYQVAGFTNVVANSSASTSGDKAFLYGTDGDDSLLATPEYAVMTSGTVTRRANGFSQTRTYARGGNDLAQLYDSAFNDRLLGTLAAIRMIGAGYYNNAIGFDSVEAFATTATTQDTINLSDDGATQFILHPGLAEMTDGLHEVSAFGFDRHNIQGAASPNATVELYGSASNDAFRGRITHSVLQGAGYLHRVNAFNSVRAFAVAGGNDVAYFFDTPGIDVFEAQGRSASHSSGAYSNRADGFSKMIAFSSGQVGGDTAVLHDAAGKDQYWGRSTEAVQKGLGYEHRANQFASTNAISSSGGADTAYLLDSAGNDYLVGEMASLRLYGIGFSNAAQGFRTVYAVASGNNPNDRLNLADSVGDDAVVLSVDQAELTSQSYSVFASGFGIQLVRSEHGGTDTVKLLTSGGANDVTMNHLYSELAGVGHYHRVDGFRDVEAIAVSAGGINSVTLSGSNFTEIMAFDTNFGVCNSTNWKRRFSGFDHATVNYSLANDVINLGSIDYELTLNGV